MLVLNKKLGPSKELPATKIIRLGSSYTTPNPQREPWIAFLSTLLSAGAIAPASESSQNAEEDSTRGNNKAVTDGITVFTGLLVLVGFGCLVLAGLVFARDCKVSANC